ncbi:MAG: hypothetical protein IKV47_05970, partial [Oscillospiraceae bacterium]|nr:hypothetical protein [Oscillospiraceae bacterium]
LERVRRHWTAFSDRLVMRSELSALDNLMRFLPYQTLVCRIMARCSVYQNGGAYGLRDQLQDAANLIHFDPSICRAQILRSCSRQYLEGDVQHWWHEGDTQPKGVRTRCSDDLLWLAWALCEYCEKTGDFGICEEQVPYLYSLPLRDDERDRYETAQPTELVESVIDHALRAAKLVLSRGVGSHGLLLFGSGDWNDGMDKVGGESVWLTWFFCHAAARLAQLLDSLGKEGGDELREACTSLASAANEAYDGKWFLRGYYDDGAPLGSSQCRECRIDSIAQSFAAFCPQADPDKVSDALDSAVNILFDSKSGIIKLFDPPFAGKEQPGYIASYGPGFRENGGQYTHGALWLIRALLHRGDTAKALELLSAILPSAKNTAQYRAEPFVLAADVYSAPGHEGEAGWSWYTGAAGWLLRITAEDILGLHLRGGKLFIEPRLENYDATYLGHSISVRNFKVKLDGKMLKRGKGIEIFSTEKDSQ